MVWKRVLVVINISLGLVAVLLLLNLFGVTFPSLGNARFYLDQSEPLCVVNWKENYNSWSDVDNCCLEVKKQLSCIEESKELESGRVNWVCQTGSGQVLKYWLNNKAYYYCQKSVYFG